MLVHQFLERSAKKSPNKIAVIAPDRSLTFRELDEAANRLAHGLIERNLERGDRVAILLENSAASAIAIFAILKAGGVFMVLNPTTKADKLAYILKDSRAAALVTDRRRYRNVQAHEGGHPHLHSVFFCDESPTKEQSAKEQSRAALEADGSLERPTFDTISDLQSRLGPAGNSPPDVATISVDLAALIYTSGSTGEPKGVMLTHRAMDAAADSVTTLLENVVDDVILCVLPLSFNYGLYQVLMSVRVGATVVLEKSFAFPHATLSKLVEHRVTGFPLVPTMAAILLELDLSNYDLSALRYVSNTAAALPRDHIRNIRERLPHVEIFSMYGLTECKRVSYLPKGQIDRRPDSVGIAIPNTEVFVMDDAGNVVPPNTIGELVVRGAHLMSGYWENAAATRKMLRTGSLPGEKFLHTGDLFRADDEGFLYFIGRTDDMIKSRGEKVPPHEVEDVLHHLEGVRDAVVFGIPDNILGEKVVAMVARLSESTLDHKAVMRHLRANLEDFMVPGRVELRDNLPKNNSGKIDKKRLRNEMLNAQS